MRIYRAMRDLPWVTFLGLSMTYALVALVVFVQMSGYKSEEKQAIVDNAANTLLKEITTTSKANPKFEEIAQEKTDSFAKDEPELDVSYEMAGSSVVVRVSGNDKSAIAIEGSELDGKIVGSKPDYVRSKTGAIKTE